MKGQIDLASYLHRKNVQNIIEKGSFKEIVAEIKKESAKGDQLYCLLMSYNDETLRHCEFTREECLLLKQTIEGEIKFCQKEIRLAKEDEDWDIMDKEHIRDRVVAAYHELIKKYQLLLPRLTWGVDVP